MPPASAMPMRSSIVTGNIAKATAADLGVEMACRQVPVVLAPSPAEVAARCDVLSIHLALAPDTKKLVNANLLARLKPGSMVLNTSRGDVIDYDALREGIRARGLRVGLDVYASEPPASTGEFVDPIVREAGVYGTHHIGASTTQAQEAIAADTVRIVQEFVTTGHTLNAVNHPFVS